MSPMGVRWRRTRKRAWRHLWCSLLILLLPSIAAAQNSSEEDDFIEPTRPAVSEGATIQRAGVLQVEYGISSDYRAPDFRSQQSAPLGIRFAVNNFLRLDFDVDAFVSQRDAMQRRETGVGDVRLGFKAIVRGRPEERLAVAFAYAAKLPSASSEKELGTGRVDHNVRFILNRKLGKADLMFNASYLNVGREDSDRRTSGAQAIFGLDYQLPKNFGIESEVFGNTVDEMQPRGLYALEALTYKVNRRLQLDGGAREGFGRDTPRVSVFIGLTFGVADLYRKRN